MRALFFNDCLGIDKVDRKAYLSGDEPFKIYKSIYGVDPTQSQLDQLVQSTQVNGKSFVDLSPSEASNYLTGQKSGTDTTNQLKTNSDPIYQAQRALEFQKKANEPIVSALQGQQQPLKDRYEKLLASIKGNQQIAENRQTVTTNNELGKRGISSNSGLYQQEMTNALNPIGQAYTDQYNTAFGNENTAESDLAYKIANAQAGNPESAISTGANLATTAQNILAGQYISPEDKALKTAQANYYNNQAKTSTNDPLGLGSIFGGK